MKKSVLLTVATLMCLEPVAALAMGKKAADEQQGAATPPSVIASQDPAALKIAVESVMTQELVLRATYREHSLKGLVPANEMDGLESAWFGAMIRFISENPLIFGGSLDRGFDPKIFKAVVKIFRERSIPMTSDGVLLLPKNGYEIRVFGNEITASGAIKGARIFLVDKNGQLVGPNLKPLTQTGFATLDGETIGLGNQGAEFARYANLSEALRSSAVAITQQGVLTTGQVAEDDEISHTWGQCLGLAADNNFSEAGDCFKAAGMETLASAASMAGDLAMTAGRGAVGGAIVGSAFPGIGTAAGAAYGALGNMLGVVYNAFLRKENITPQQIRNLMDVMAMYTFQPNAYGEILPKNGEWAVTKTGYVRRVTDFGGGKLVLLDVLGNPIMRTQTYVLSDDAFRSVPRTGATPPATSAAPATTGQPEKRP